MFVNPHALSEALTRHLPTLGVRRGVTAALIGAAVSFFIPIRPAITLGRSMEPTLNNGQPFLFTNRRASSERYRQGDVLVFREKGLPTVKRVAAAAGQTLWLVPRSTVDPRPLWALAPGEDVTAWKRRFPWMGLRRYVVPEGKVFLVGDSILSRDSRDYGPIDERLVMGRVMWPELTEDLETWSFFHKLTPEPNRPAPHSVRIARR